MNDYDIFLLSLISLVFLFYSSIATALSSLINAFIYLGILYLITGKKKNYNKAYLYYFSIYVCFFTVLLPVCIFSENYFLKKLA